MKKILIIIVMLSSIVLTACGGGGGGGGGFVNPAGPDTSDASRMLTVKLPEVSAAGSLRFDAKGGYSNVRFYGIVFKHVYGTVWQGQVPEFVIQTTDKPKLTYEIIKGADSAPSGKLICMVIPTLKIKSSAENKEVMPVICVQKSDSGSIAVAVGFIKPVSSSSEEELKKQVESAEQKEKDSGNFENINTTEGKPGETAEQLEERTEKEQQTTPGGDSSNPGVDPSNPGKDSGTTVVMPDNTPTDITITFPEI